MKAIILTLGRIATVDDEDFDRVNQFKWHAVKKGFRYYGRRSFRVKGKQVFVYLHNFILGVVGVDHKDGDGLNDRKENLRAATSKQNKQAFRRKSSGKSSPYRGVSWDSRREKWQAKTSVDNQTVHLGRFESEEGAARAYDAGARRLFGEFASPNFSI